MRKVVNVGKMGTGSDFALLLFPFVIRLGAKSVPVPDFSNTGFDCKYIYFSVKNVPLVPVPDFSTVKCVPLGLIMDLFAYFGE